ncbi:hypothetical protein BTR25_07655 [Bacillus sp. MRMR6]|nr:hypothetical protein BTR25_07655 [Bacillus sp. MRMR6]
MFYALCILLALFESLISTNLTLAFLHFVQTINVCILPMRSSTSYGSRLAILTLLSNNFII